MLRSESKNRSQIFVGKKKYLKRENSQLAWNGAKVTKAITVSSTVSQYLPKYRWREGGEELETHP